MKMKQLPLFAAIALAGSSVLFAQDFAQPGAELTVGESAVVPHLVPNGPQVPIEFTVTAIEEGSAADLEGFNVPPQLSEHRPVYVHYSYTNLGEEDISHQQVGAIVVIDDRNQEHASAVAMNSPQGSDLRAKCPTNTMTNMTAGASQDGCLIFMIHGSGSVASVAYKGGYKFEPGSDTRADYPIYYNPVRWTPGETTAGAGRIVTPGG